jgi:hypothetical protein
MNSRLHCGETAEALGLLKLGQLSVWDVKFAGYIYTHTHTHTHTHTYIYIYIYIQQRFWEMCCLHNQSRRKGPSWTASSIWKARLSPAPPQRCSPPTELHVTGPSAALLPANRTTCHRPLRSAVPRQQNYMSPAPPQRCSPTTELHVTGPSAALFPANRTICHRPLRSAVPRQQNYMSPAPPQRCSPPTELHVTGPSAALFPTNRSTCHHEVRITPQPHKPTARAHGSSSVSRCLSQQITAALQAASCDLWLAPFAAGSHDVTKGTSINPIQFSSLRQSPRRLLGPCYKDCSSNMEAHNYQQSCHNFQVQGGHADRLKAVESPSCPPPQSTGNNAIFFISPPSSFTLRCRGR